MRKVENSVFLFKVGEKRQGEGMLWRGAVRMSIDSSDMPYIHHIDFTVMQR